MYADRKPLYAKLEKSRNSRVLTYVTGDRRQMETQIHAEAMDHFLHHLDAIGDVEKISLFLYTRGGETLAAWSLVNMIRQFCKELEVIVPFKAHSAGTLMSLAANKIVMTKQATLGPIDPSVNTPLNPQIVGAPPQARVPVSVEDVNGFIEFAKTALKEDQLNTAFQALAGNVHPLVLGNAFRARGQIRMLAKKLMGDRFPDEDKARKILEFLCSESGSHDYTINRREAGDQLGLPIEKPNDELYGLIKEIYDDIAKELELTTPYDPNVLLGGQGAATYSVPRSLVESVDGGSHAFVSEGNLARQQVQVQPGVVQNAIRDDRTFEGWRHRNA
jgi:Serine dehydrogenase proteinase